MDMAGNPGRYVWFTALYNARAYYPVLAFNLAYGSFSFGFSLLLASFPAEPAGEAIRWFSLPQNHIGNFFRKN